MPRPRFFKGRVISGTKKHRDLKKLIRSVAEESGATPIDGPCMAVIDFMFALKTGAGYRDTRPDLDNLAKLVLDALNGIAYHDDGQVSTLVCRKWRDGPAGIKIFIVPQPPIGEEVDI